MDEEQAEEDAASRATILVEQTTLTLPDQSRTSNILLSQDQLLYITRANSHGSDDEDCDESAYDVSVDDESCHNIIYINKEAKQLPGSSGDGASEATPSTVPLSRADTGASSASATPLLSKRSISTVSLGDAPSSQPGAQHVRGVEYTTSSDEECADERPSNSPNVTTATIISQDELEARIRQQVLQEAVVAQVIDPESPAEPTKPDLKEPTNHRTRRRFLLMVLFLMTSIASAIATALAITLSDDDDDRVEELEKDLDREREEDRRPPPDPGFDGSDPAFDGAAMSEEDDRYMDDTSEDQESFVLQDILSTKSPNVTVIDSPQYKAFQWMLSNDIYNPTESFFWEYYALATLFFATNGNTTWRRRDNWLDPMVSPCDWYPGGLCRSEAFSRNHGSRHLTEGRVDQPQLSITSLDLGSNDLDGTVPEELALLSSLQVLNLDDNPLLLGSLISNFSSLSSLQHFSARRVGFMGTFPPNLQTMTLLESFELQGDSGMNGATFPTELWSLPSLKLLSLEGVGVTGTIPQTTICPNEAYLKDNQLSGQLPVLTSIDWQELEVLDLRNNRLTGLIPSELSNLWDRNLLVLRLEGNDLEGEVQFCDSYQQSIERTGSSHLLSADCADDFVSCECCTYCCAQDGSCTQQ